VLGQSVVGAVWLNSNYYFPASGSAVASTVFAGSLALLLNALPCLRRQPEKVMELLHMSLEPINSTGCDSSTSYPNNVYGYGKINITQTVDFFLVSEDFKCERERCECIWVGSNDPIVSQILCYLLDLFSLSLYPGSNLNIYVETYQPTTQVYKIVQMCQSKCIGLCLSVRLFCWRIS